MTSGRQAFRLSALALFTVLLGVIATACGSSSGSGATSTAESTGGSSSKATAVAAKWYKGTFKSPEAAPVKPPAGKDVWAISVGQLSTSSKEATGAFLEGARNLGWGTHLVDGKFDPNEWQAGIRSAVAANADAIYTYAIDCPSIASALKEADAAGIPVIGSEGLDCKGEGGYAYQTRYSSGDFASWGRSLGEATGSWVAAEKPDAKILEFVESDLFITVYLAEGFEKTVADYCPGCEVVEKIEFTGDELGPDLQSKTEQALLRNPDVDVIYGNYDDPVNGSIAPAVRNVGRTDEIAVIGCEGQVPNVELMWEGAQAAGSGIEPEWEGYAGLDATVRTLAGQDPTADSGNGTQLFDPQHNMPPKGEAFSPEPPVDYKADYEKAWGIG